MWPHKNKHRCVWSRIDRSPPHSYQKEITAAAAVHEEKVENLRTLDPSGDFPCVWVTPGSL